MPEYSLFVGNPGVGKSTILNGLISELRFKSGFSPGQGMTSVLQCEEKGGKFYMDTPGLADVEKRKLAAKEIEKALKKDGDYRIFFVLTLESGRVRPQDKATMELVLQAVPGIGHNYGIIFNKISRRALEELTQNPRRKTPTPAEEVLATLYAKATPTRFISWAAWDVDLEDADNVVKPLNPELLRFIEAMPAIHIGSSEVGAIAISDFDALEQKYFSLLDEMRRDNRRVQTELQGALQALQKQPSQPGWLQPVLSLVEVFSPIALGAMVTKSCVIA